MSDKPSMNLAATMKVLSTFLLLQTISLGLAGVIARTAEIIEGPSSKTTLVGPDGSVITSVAQGAKIVADGHSALVSGPDTASLLKSADHPAVLETKLQPLISVAAPLVQAVAPVVASKTTVSEHGQVVAHGHSALIGTHVEPVLAHVGLTQVPVVQSETSLVRGHLQPVVAAHVAPIVAQPLIETHVAPIVATKAAVLNYEPIVTHNHISGKTSVSEQSQTIVHPHTLVGSHVEPVIAVQAPVVKAHIEPVAVHAVPIVSAVHTKAAVVAHAAESVIPAVQAHQVVGTKTTVSENAQSISHPSTFVKSSEGLVAHPVPIVAKEVVPVANVIGSKTTITGHSQSIVHPGTLVKAQPIVGVYSSPVVAEHVHAVPVVAVHPVPVIGAKTTVSENAQTILSHSW